MNETIGPWSGRSVVAAFEFDFPGRRLPEPILWLFKEQRELVENAREIHIGRNEMNMAVTISALISPVRWIYLEITDETLDSLGVDPGILPPLFPPLPVIKSQYPIMGWRLWRLERGMYGFRGTKWDTPFLVAECFRSPGSVPHDRCRCGIYLSKNVPQYSSPDFAVALGLTVAEKVVEHEHGYRTGIARCIAITSVHSSAHGWDGIPIMSTYGLLDLEATLRNFPATIPYPNDSPAP